MSGTAGDGTTPGEQPDGGLAWARPDEQVDATVPDLADLSSPGDSAGADRRPIAAAELTVPSIGRRMLAGVVDTAGVALTWLVGLVAVSLGLAIANVDTTGVAGDRFGAAMVLAIPGLAILWEAVTTGLWDASPGKRVAGLTVVDGGGEPPGAVSLVLRAMTATLLWITGVGAAADWLTGALSADRRTLHDRITGTTVVRGTSADTLAGPWADLVEQAEAALDRFEAWRAALPAGSVTAVLDDIGRRMEEGAIEVRRVAESGSSLARLADDPGQRLDRRSRAKAAGGARARFERASALARRITATAAHAVEVVDDPGRLADLPALLGTDLDELAAHVAALQELDQIAGPR